MNKDYYISMKKHLQNIKQGKYDEYNVDQWKALAKHILRRAIEDSNELQKEPIPTSSKLIKAVTSYVIDLTEIKVDSIVEIQPGKDAKPVRGIVKYITNNSIEILISKNNQVCYSATRLATDQIPVKVILY